MIREIFLDLCGEYVQPHHRLIAEDEAADVIAFWIEEAWLSDDVHRFCFLTEIEEALLAR